MRQFSLRPLLRSPFGRSLTLILLAFTLIPVLALIVLNALVTPQQLLARAETQMVTVANLIQTSTTRWITAAGEQLDAALTNPVTLQNATFVLRATTDVPRPAQVLAQDLGALIRQPLFSRLHLVRPDGTVALSTDIALKGSNLGVQLTDSPGFWGFDTLPLTGTMAAILWQPVIDARRQTIGFLVGELKQESLLEILNENRIGLGQTGEAFLLSDDLMALTPLRDAPGDQPLRLGPSVVSAIRANAPEFRGLYADYAGRAVVGAVQPLQAPLRAWLVVQQHQSEALETLNAILQVTIVFTALIAALAVAAALLTTQRIATPLQTLAQAAHSMSQGQLSTRVKIARRDEFGSLGSSFNAMASGLEKAFKDLGTSNEKLKNRADQLQAITNVGQHVITLLELDRLMDTIVTEIRRDLGYDAVRLYMLNDDGTALTLRAAADSSGETHVSTQPIIYAMDVTNVVGEAAIMKRVVFLPTRISIPLLLGGGERLIGVLDIKTSRVGGFKREEVDVLQILSNQLAIAIRNAELYLESEQARRAADDANRQKSEFLSNMSHELRTPLNVIIGYSHSILNRPAMYNNVPLPDVYRDGLNSIMAGGQHLLGLINDILDLSKIEAGQIDLSIEPVDALPILQGVRQTALGLVKKGVQVRADYPMQLPRIMGDELRVRQILLNLVSNAAKFTDQGFITINARPQGQKLMFSVADTGVGIPDEAKTMLFNRFQQATRDVIKKHGGSGLGLSISRQLTVLQGGEIWFESKVGEGSTFYFTIPLAQEPTGADAQPALPPAHAPAHAPAEEISSRVSVFAPAEGKEQPLMRQVVLFDMRAETRGRLQTALTEAGYDVLLADNAERAQMLATALLPDVIVLHLHSNDSPNGSADPAADVEQMLRREPELARTPFVVVRDAHEAQAARAAEGEWWKLVVEQVNHALKEPSRA